MSSLASQDLILPTQSSAPIAGWSPPAWTPAQGEDSEAASDETTTGLSEEQRALDQAAAAEAGMGQVEVDTLGNFGLRPSELDPAAASRMAVGMKRMQALLACDGGNELGCELAGPGLVGHESWQGVGGDTSEDLVVEGEEFTLRLNTRTTADGRTERVLFYKDIDGTFLSGVSAEPVEGLSEHEAPAEQPPAPDEEGLGSFLEGAILGDFAGNDTWSAVAGQTTVGLIPIAGQIADARDTLAAVRDVAEGKDGGWARLGAAGVGWIPGIGDALKGGARVGMRLGTEVVEEGAERLVKEAAEEGGERIAKEGAEEAAETAGHAPEGVWSHVGNPGPTLPNTQIPRWFELEAGGQRVWVAPNATEHMEEYLTRSAMTHGMPMNSQALMESLHAAVETAVAQGMKMDTPVVVGPWELVISPSRGAGQLPCLKHAVYRP